jgi:Uma2 family endonuclease
MVICDPARLTDDRGIVGAPDLIVEILSPANPGHDRVYKFNKYLKAGVREYWILSPHEKTLSVFTLDGDRYITQAYSENDKAPVGILPGCEIDLASVFAH